MGPLGDSIMTNETAIAILLAHGIRAWVSGALLLAEDVFVDAMGRCDARVVAVADVYGFLGY
jgi:hypothetical protein